LYALEGTEADQDIVSLVADALAGFDEDRARLGLGSALERTVSSPRVTETPI